MIENTPEPKRTTITQHIHSTNTTAHNWMRKRCEKDDRNYFQLWWPKETTMVTTMTAKSESNFNYDDRKSTDLIYDDMRNTMTCDGKNQKTVNVRMKKRNWKQNNLIKKLKNNQIWLRFLD